MTLGVLIGIVVAGIVLVVLAVHRSGGSAVAALDDTGQAIMEFGKAYPALPIRDVVMTADKQAAFLRLADTRAGLVQSVGRHFLSRLIPPGSISVKEGSVPHSLNIRFRESAFGGGEYRFVTGEEAAEVSLWLVGTLLAGQETVDPQTREGPGDA